MESSGDVLIHLEGVTKVFLTDEVETHALSGIELEIRRGEFVSIAGPSGCGKSTLFSILERNTQKRTWIDSGERWEQMEPARCWQRVYCRRSARTELNT
jgi:ABC-type lipoprotein export system ATPase subunit